jgi:hypothetical protein
MLTHSLLLPSSNFLSLSLSVSLCLSPSLTSSLTLLSDPNAYLPFEVKIDTSDYDARHWSANVDSLRQLSLERQKMREKQQQQQQQQEEKEKEEKEREGVKSVSGWDAGTYAVGVDQQVKSFSFAKLIICFSFCFAVSCPLCACVRMCVCACCFLGCSLCPLA